MAKKLFVINTATGHKTPFLRGVLVQSLSAAGLPFADAYDMAQQVRGLLESTTETLSTLQLKKFVSQQLAERYSDTLRQAYESGGQEHPITVESANGSELFSVGLLVRYLQGSGIGREEAQEGARLVQEQLRNQGKTTVSSQYLRRIVYETLKKSCGEKSADLYLCRCQFNDSGKPLVILIGGTSGAGKSTVANRLAYLLDIVRTQSTDIMREIIRCYLVPHVAPTLDYSSYDAWRGLPEIEPTKNQTESENLVVTGFLAQFDTVKVALEATLQRAVKERQDLILDGVHVLPTRLNLDDIAKKAVVVPIVLAITTIKQLENHLRHRSREQPDRNSKRHQEELAGIWELQKLMVDQAEKHAIPVIVNWSIGETVEQIMQEIMRHLSIHFPPDPAALK